MRTHVAIMREPFLRYVVEGRKTIESRFSITRRAPFGALHSGDRIWFKRSGGPYVAWCRAGTVWFYEGCSPGTIENIRTLFADRIRATDDAFWAERAHKRYVTLVELADVSTDLRNVCPVVDGVSVYSKIRGRSGWVVLP